MFSTSNSSDLVEFLKPLEGQVTKPMNLELSKEFARDEIYKTLQQMQPKKNNGMPPLFFQKYWHTIRDSVTNAMLNSLNTSQFSICLKHISLH